MPSFAQMMDEATQKKLTKKFAAFIPDSLIVIDTATSDFNSDGLRDVAVVLAYNTNPEQDGGFNRQLLVLQQTKTGYSVSAKCNAAILCQGCGGVFGDPYAGITFKKNVLTINHYGGSSWRWASNYTFRFQNIRWEMIGMTADSYWINAGCDNVEDGARNLSDANFSTRKMHLIETEGENCKPKANRWVKLKSYPKVTLNNFNAEEDYWKEINY
jgi:hypothetical protein